MEYYIYSSNGLMNVNNQKRILRFVKKEGAYFVEY